jgi:hypothetical protein
MALLEDTTVKVTIDAKQAVKELRELLVEFRALVKRGEKVAAKLKKKKL